MVMVVVLVVVGVVVGVRVRVVVLVVLVVGVVVGVRSGSGRVSVVCDDESNDSRLTIDVAEGKATTSQDIMCTKT